MARSVVETIVGAVVLAVAVVFTAYAFTQSGSVQASGYELIARFDRADGIKKGTDVSLAGVKVGSVVSTELDAKDYVAVVRFVVDGKLALPTDTSAKIVSESLLGGAMILLEVGSDSATLKAGGQITKTQGAISLIEKLVQALAGSVSQDTPRK